MLELVYKMPKLPMPAFQLQEAGQKSQKICLTSSNYSELPENSRQSLANTTQPRQRRLARSLASLSASLQPEAFVGPLPFPPLSLPLSVSCSLELTLRVPHPLRCLPPLEGVPWVKSRLASWQSCRRRWIQHFPAERPTADSVHREV